jgi:PAS domain S-box-containing protein
MSKQVASVNPVSKDPAFDLVQLCRYFSERSPQPVIVVEGKTHIVRYLNDAFTRLAGKRRTELTGRPFAEAVPEGEKNGCLALFDRVYRTGTPETLLEQEHGQSPPIYWSYSVWAIFGANECPVGVVIQVTDVTEVALFRKQVVEMNEQLLLSSTRQHELTEIAEKANQTSEIEKAANAAKDEFLSRISHELRTPLNAILGFGQILEMQEESFTSLQNQNVQYILAAGHHLLDLINEVLDITRINAPDSTLSLEPVSLNDVFQEALNMAQTLARPREISISQGIAPTPSIFVLADRQRLLQILLNLLSNAIKYNKPQGQVLISAEILPSNRVRFQITDTGHGITVEDMPKLFTPFARLNAEKLGVEGTGLGLVLCQRLVQAMNGSLHVESQAGQGSTFSVELPQAQPPEPREHTDSASVSQQTPETISVTSATQTILLIEDNISNFRLVETILKVTHNVHLLGAIQGGIGVELARHHQPDLILLDLHLPDMMGDEVLRHLQCMPETQHIPVIILSADATPGQITRLLAAGARHYLTKPINLKHFLKIVDDTIGIYEQES